MTEEQKQALIEEAKRRGFINGAKINNESLPGTAGSPTLYGNRASFDTYNDTGKWFLRIDGEKVWYDGNWAIITNHSKNYNPIPLENYQIY